LKGHIELAQVKFPKGTRGSQIDIMARQFLWKEGINYGHGTGHGVGHFLCVHEGPQNIRIDENPTALEPGMLISNEPGVYRANEYGIRTENLVLVTFAEKTDFGEFYQFETLSLCPIDKALIDRNILTENEINWLNNYHQKVFEILSPFLNEEERKWFQQKCLPL
ncbi:MAG TPA: M24 family metallopeptidase C-terminal domain-containing protein, partial [Paludibacteraceae bacterium]|nr:M24 family metallopeptidase C-terminal domain-containing protein [Paludibacteraceae bacterium]